MTYLIEESCSCKLKQIVSDEETGERVCASCGLVLLSQPVNNTDLNVNKHHYHTKTESGTVVGPPAARLTEKEYARLRKLDAIVLQRAPKAPRLRQIEHARAILENLSEMLPTTFAITERVKQRALFLYGKLLKGQMARGRSGISLLGSCLYIACREAGMPISIQEIDELVKDRILLQDPELPRLRTRGTEPLKKRSVRRTYWKVVKYFQDTGLPLFEDDSSRNNNNGNASRFVSSILSRMGTGTSYGRLADPVKNILFRQTLELLQLEKVRMVAMSKNPIVIAASALYVVGSCRYGLKITQNELAIAAGISNVALRTRVKDIAKALEA